MKKKFGLILLALTMCMGSIAPVYAAANQNTSTVIKHVDPRYKDIQMIITSFEVLPSGRAEYGAQIFLSEYTGLFVSSSYIRERVREGRGIEGLVPKNVEEYIIANGLYRKP